MNYTQLPTTYKEDVIAEAMYAREMEYFHYEFDATNFRHLIQTAPDEAFRQEMAKRLDATLKQMETVEAIYAALQSQITSPEAHAAAVQRAIEKRKAAP